MVYPWIGCGKCWYCQAGSEHLCPTPRALGVNKDGGYADHVLVPHAKYLYPYGNLPVELACLYACSGITAFGAVKKAVGHDAGKPILVIGAGGVGLMGVRFAKSVLGREPIVADIDENKRKLALENGACAALDPRDKEARKQIMDLTGGTGVGAAIDFVGAEASAQFGVRALGRGGRLIVVGLFGGTFSMPLADVRLHRLPDHGLGDRQPGRDEGDDGPRHRRQGDARAGHQAQARRGRRHAAGAAQGPDHGARRPGAVSQASRALVHAFETGALAPAAGVLPARRAGAVPGHRRRAVVPARVSPPEEGRLVGRAAHRERRLPAWPGAADQAQGGELRQHRARLGRCSPRAARLVCSGSNDDGAASLEKQVGKAFGLDGTLSKFHCRVFWLTRADKNPPDYWRDLASLRPVGDGSWLSQPGIFSWDRIDDGSALLAGHLPDDLAGHVADFGCGWGYLSREVLARSPGIARIDLIDAEHRAIEAARANIADARASFHWLDLTQEAAPATYDAIVCNPPFHAGRAAEPGLGQTVIAAAARALRPGGRFYMVANRGLPYEPLLKANFASFETLADNNKFRVSRAVR